MNSKWQHPRHSLLRKATPGAGRRGLAIYFAVLVPLSAVFQAPMLTDSLSWVWALMWTPAAASVVARVVLREGFADISFRLGGRRGWKALGLALSFPIVFGLIAYGIAWTTGLVQFSPQPIGLAAPYVEDAASPPSPLWRCRRPACSRRFPDVS